MLLAEVAFEMAFEFDCEVPANSALWWECKKEEENEIYKYKFSQRQKKILEN